MLTEYNKYQEFGQTSKVRPTRSSVLTIYYQPATIINTKSTTVYKRPQQQTTNNLTCTTSTHFHWTSYMKRIVYNKAAFNWSN